MSCELHSLLPLRGDVLSVDAIINRLGFTPGMVALRKFMESQNFHLCSGGVFKRAAALIRTDGRAPSEVERLESTQTQPHRKVEWQCRT